MNPIERSEVLPLADYETIRPRFRARVIEEKRQRRAPLGEHMTIMFENRDTVLLQIQEMLRTERITKETGIAHELRTYNELVPGDGELSMTLFIEVPDKTQRDDLLAACAGMETHVALEVAGERVSAIASEKAGAQATRTTAVQYYKIALGPLEAQLRSTDPGVVAVVIDHPAYQARAVLEPHVVSQLRGDLTWSS